MARKENEQPKNPEGARQKYEKPRMRTIELPLEETLAEGCKVGGDPACSGTFEPGS